MIYLNYPGYSIPLEERKYFTLDECLKYYNHENFGVFSEGWADTMALDVSQEPGNSLFANKCYLAVPLLFRHAGNCWPLPIGSSDSAKNKKIFQEFFFGRLWPTYSNCFVGSINTYKDADEDEELEAVYSEFWKTQLVPLLINTWRKYSYLVSMYEENLSKLLDRVKSASASRSNFNDTPQETAPTDVWDDPTHETTLTKTLQETESDLATPMERIDEVRRKIEDIYAAWVYEFDKIFVKEGLL